jgi:hypothetical protein
MQNLPDFRRLQTADKFGDNSRVVLLAELANGFRIVFGQQFS